MAGTDRLPAANHNPKPGEHIECGQIEKRGRKDAKNSPNVEVAK
jgi:hypothetical protein